MTAIVHKYDIFQVRKTKRIMLLEMGGRNLPFSRGRPYNLGENTMDVSIQEPQLHPPPPSGESNMPAAGIVLSQQSGRNRFQLVVSPSF